MLFLILRLLYLNDCCVRFSASVQRRQFRERLANTHCDLDILLSWSGTYTASSINCECLTSTSSVDAESSSRSEYDEHEHCGCREQQSL